MMMKSYYLFLICLVLGCTAVSTATPVQGGKSTISATKSALGILRRVTELLGMLACTEKVLRRIW